MLPDSFTLAWWAQMLAVGFVSIGVRRNVITEEKSQYDRWLYSNAGPYKFQQLK